MFPSSPVKTCNPHYQTSCHHCISLYPISKPPAAHRPSMFNDQLNNSVLRAVEDIFPDCCSLFQRLNRWLRFQQILVPFGIFLIHKSMNNAFSSYFLSTVNLCICILRLKLWKVLLICSQMIQTVWKLHLISFRFSYRRNLAEESEAKARQ